MRLWWSWSRGLALSLVLLARHASAAQRCGAEAGASPRERAKAQYEAGVDAYEEKRYRDAIDHLTCANQLLPSAELAYDIAVTYDAMQDTASALRWFREYRRQGGADADAEPVLSKVAELEAALQARGVQQVTFSSIPAGATLRVDDQPMGLTPFTLELKPGPHRYRLSAAHHQSTEASFELRPDRSLDVVVKLTPERRDEAPGARMPERRSEAPGAPASEARDPGRSAPPPVAVEIGPWTWASLGAGALSLGAALGVELRRGQIEDELGRVPQAHFEDRYDAMTAHQTAARVLFGVGAAALTAGIVLFTIEANREPDSPELAFAACAGGGLCVAASGGF